MCARKGKFSEKPMIIIDPIYKNFDKFLKELGMEGMVRTPRECVAELKGKL